MGRRGGQGHGESVYSSLCDDTAMWCVSPRCACGDTSLKHRLDTVHFFCAQNVDASRVPKASRSFWPIASQHFEGVDYREYSTDFGTSQPLSTWLILQRSVGS